MEAGDEGVCREWRSDIVIGLGRSQWGRVWVLGDWQEGGGMWQGGEARGRGRSCVGD